MNKLGFPTVLLVGDSYDRPVVPQIRICTGTDCVNRGADLDGIVGVVRQAKCRRVGYGQTVVDPLMADKNTPRADPAYLGLPSAEVGGDVSFAGLLGFLLAVVSVPSSEHTSGPGSYACSLQSMYRHKCRWNLYPGRVSCWKRSGGKGGAGWQARRLSRDVQVVAIRTGLVLSFENVEDVCVPQNLSSGTRQSCVWTVRGGDHR